MECLRGWAYVKLGRHTKPSEVVLRLRKLDLTVDTSQGELLCYWEIWHEHCYDAIALDSPECVVDVGANIGAFSLYQALNKGAGRVIAFEPSPAVFSRLAKNVALNNASNVRLVNAAVGDAPGHLSFAEGAMSINCKVAPNGPIKVRCVTLDEELADIPRVDFLKIDTEGYETQVLRGGAATLGKTLAVVCELHFPGEKQELDAILYPAGFTLSSESENLVFYRRTGSFE
jgi:FkbM family methyltransferase